MDNHSHILISDDCDDCHYISNTFTFLRLPLNKMSFENLIDHPEKLDKKLAILVCKNIENQQKKKLNELIKPYDPFLISFNEFNQKIETPVHFLKMPFSKHELEQALNHAKNYQNKIESFDFDYPVFDRLIGKSKEICKIKSLIKQVAYSDTTVLIMGQSGTGKDVIASCIHHLSTRRNNLLVPINCGAIPSELMESELFGHEKGAFTGAITRRPGRFEMANTGTLFLDEIGDMPMPMQVKLLRVIQERKIERVGGNNSINVDVRLIAATNQKLEELIQQNKFREDLFYRINVFPIQVPSLNERSDDIPLIMDFHLDKIYERLKHRVEFTDSAKEILCHYPWPGNIRELANFIERMVILFPDHVVDENDIDSVYKQKKQASTNTEVSLANENTKTPFNIKEYMSKVEQQLIKVALDRSNGIINAAAEYLSMGRATLVEKMKKYNL